MTARLHTETPAAWPALLTTDLACAYTQLSEQSFRWLATQRGLKPADCAGLAVTRWRRADIDRMIDSLPERGAEIAPQEPGDGRSATLPSPANDPAAAALARAAQRVRKSGGG
jgi:hypothetical protein